MIKTCILEITDYKKYVIDEYYQKCLPEKFKYIQH